MGVSEYYIWGFFLMALIALITILADLVQSGAFDRIAEAIERIKRWIRDNNPFI